MKSFWFAASIMCITARILSAQNLQQELQQKISTVKDSIARNQSSLRQYSWTAHTEISLKRRGKENKG